jgi:phosphatidylglycerophosphatase C
MTLPQVSPGDSSSEQPTVAAFDFDGTLTRGGSIIAFLVSLRGVLPVLLAVVRTSPKLFRAALFGGQAADDSKEMLLGRALGGLPEKTVEKAAEDFARRHLARNLRPDMRDRLEWHRSAGHKVVIVSASPECYVARAGELLGVDAALGTRLGVDTGGRLTGRYEGKNCRGAEKYARLVGWLRSSGFSGAGSAQPVIWAYGNSRGDLRLLQAADHGVDVGQLGRFGRLHEFPTLADVSSASRSR